MKILRANQSLAPARQVGFTLVELMVAMVIGVIVLLGLIIAFGANRESFRFNNQMLQLQDSGRFAMDSIIRDLRMAGDAGCIRSALDQEEAFVELTNKMRPVPAGVGFTAGDLIQGVDWNAATTTLSIYGIPVEGNTAVLWSDCTNSEITTGGAASPAILTNASYRVTTGYRTYTYNPPVAATATPGTVTVSDPVIGDDNLLLENVEHFAVCFGVDDSGTAGGDMEGRVSRWIFGTSTPTADQLQKTIAVQVQMLVASDPEGAGTSGGCL